MKNKPRVLVVSTSRKTRGGITAVLKAYESTKMWKDYHCRWIETHRDSNTIVKFCYFISALVEFTAIAPFYDIVHLHFSLDGTARRKKHFMRLAKFYGKKTIIHLHCGTQIHDIWDNNYDYLFRSCDKAILLSKSLQTMVEEHTGITDKYEVVYNPCLSELKSINLRDRKKEILFAGTLYEGKGYRDLIRAFGRIAHNYSDWSVVLAGNGEMNLGKQIAKELNIENQVKFLGWVAEDEKDKVFKEASIFCLPSYAEGFPMAVLDAFSYGLPVLSTPVGGIPDVAVNGKNMLLFDPGDIDALAEKLKQLISDRELQFNMCAESQLMAATTFNLSNIIKQLASIYDNVATNNH